MLDRRSGTGFAVLLAALVLTASHAAAKPLPHAVTLAERPLPLAAVRLTGGPLKHAQEADAEYPLKLEPDRMLAYYRIRAGLEPKAKEYGGWDGPGNPSRFFDKEYPLPEPAIRSATRVTVRFEAADGREPAAVFGIRTIRTDAEPKR